MRTTRTSIAIGHAFRLSGFDAEQPPGTYVVDIDEEPIDGLSFLARRRVGAILYLPAGAAPGNCRYAVPLTMAELDGVVVAT